MNEQEAEIASSLQKLLSVSGNKNDSGNESGEDAKVGVAPAAASSYVLSPSQIEFYQVCGCGEKKDVCGTCGHGCQIKQEEAVAKGLAIYEDDMFVLLNDEEDDYDSDEDNTKYDIIHSDEELEVDTDEDDTDDDDYVPEKKMAAAVGGKKKKEAAAGGKKKKKGTAAVSGKKKRKKYKLSDDGRENIRNAQLAVIDEGSSNLRVVARAASIGKLHLRFVQVMAEADAEPVGEGLKEFFYPIVAGDKYLRHGVKFEGKAGLAKMCLLLGLKYETRACKGTLHKQVSIMRNVLTSSVSKGLAFEESSSTAGTGKHKTGLNMLSNDVTFEFLRGTDYDEKSFVDEVNKYKVSKKAPAASSNDSIEADKSDESEDSAALSDSS